MGTKIIDPAISTISAKFALVLLTTMLAAGPGATQPVRKPLVRVGELTFTGIGQADELTLRAMIETALVGTGRLEVISSSQALEDERQTQAATGRRPASGANRPQPRRPDYLIGGLTTAQIQPRNDMMLKLGCAATFGEGAYVPGIKLTLTVDLQLTEVATNSIKRAPRSSKIVTEPARCMQDKRFETSTALRRVADEVALQTTTAIFPMAVVRISAINQLVLNYGSSVLAAGQYLRIYGEEIRTPDPTNPGQMNVSRDAVGYAVVAETQQTSSTADVKGVAPELVKPGMVLELTDPETARAAIAVWTRQQRGRR